MICFPLGERAPVKGVISGVLLTEETDSFLEVADGCGARRLKRYRDGKEEGSESVVLEFVGELPERIFIYYVSYRVSAYVRTQLRCSCCQEYGYVAKVCRRRKERCRRCGKNGCSDGLCDISKDKAICFHCGGNHEVGEE